MAYDGLAIIPTDKPALLDRRGQESCGAKQKEPMEDPTLLRRPVLSVFAVWAKLAHRHPQRCASEAVKKLTNCRKTQDARIENE
jgi:hypothetical protein